MGIPVRRTVFICPDLKEPLVLLAHLYVGRRDALKDIVDLALGDVKDGRVPFGDIPLDVESDHAPETDECVAHEGNTTTLGRGAEKGDAHASLLDPIGAAARDGGFLGEQVAGEGDEPAPYLLASATALISPGGA